MTLMMTQNRFRVVARAKPAAVHVETLSRATAASPLGHILLARSAKGVCAILLGESIEELQADLAGRFPHATLVMGDAMAEADLETVLRFIEAPGEGLHLTLDMRGTPFQRRVWEKLRTIPVGKTVSYGDLARWVDPLANPRAVASACAANAIALAIPCHRVVRGNGELAGYRWGIDRKRQLIQKEVTA